MAQASGSGFTLDFDSIGLDLAKGPDMTAVSHFASPQEIECTVKFDPVIFPPESLMCTGFETWEITVPPTERQLKRYKRALRRSKPRANKTRRRKSLRQYKYPKGKAYKEVMRISQVTAEGDNATITLNKKVTE